MKLKQFFKTNLILLLIALLSAVALAELSYLTVLNYSCEMREEFIKVSNDEIIGEVEFSLKYGKVLKTYYGLDELLVKGKSLLSEDSILYVQTSEGSVIATSEDEDVVTLPNDALVIHQEISAGDTVVGELVTYSPKEAVRSELRDVNHKAVVVSVIVFMALLAVFTTLTIVFNLGKKAKVLIIVAGILIQGILLTILFSPVFVSGANRTVSGVGEYLKVSIESMEEKGITLDEIDGFESFLDEKSQQYGWIDSIQWVNMAEYDRTNENVIVIDLSDTDGKLVLVNISSAYVTTQIIKMVLTFVATIVIAVIFMFEFLDLPDMISFRQSESFNCSCPEQYVDVSRVLRLTKFLTSTFCYMCLSFSALQIKEINVGCFGFSPEITAALSISVCSFTEAIGMLIMPLITKKMSSRNLFVIATAVLIAANFGCFVTKSTALILATRFFAGLGSAGNKQVTNMIIANGYSNDSERQNNLTQTNSGTIGGILCGMGFGSIITGVFGYAATFLGAAIGCVLFLAVQFILVPWHLIGENIKMKRSEVSTFNFNVIKKVLGSAMLWKQILLMLIPHYILLMIIVSLIPGRIQSAGIDGVVLTYANLLNGVFGLYLGVYIQKFLLKRFKSQLTMIVLVFVLGALSILIVDVPFPVVMLLLSAALTGIIDGVGTPLTMDLFLGNVDLMMNLDEDTSLMIYSMIGCLAMSVAPVLLELCEKNVIVLVATACAYGVISLLILSIFGKSKKKQQV